MINTYKEWEGFRGGNWQRETDVRSFILKNFTPYDGDESFLAQPTAKTCRYWYAGWRLMCPLPLRNWALCKLQANRT